MSYKMAHTWSRFMKWTLTRKIWVWFCWSLDLFANCERFLVFTIFFFFFISIFGFSFRFNIYISTEWQTWFQMLVFIGLVPFVLAHLSNVLVSGAQLVFESHFNDAQLLLKHIGVYLFVSHKIYEFAQTLNGISTIHHCSASWCNIDRLL